MNKKGRRKNIEMNNKKDFPSKEYILLKITVLDRPRFNKFPL